MNEGMYQAIIAELREISSNVRQLVDLMAMQQATTLNLTMPANTDKLVGTQTQPPNLTLTEPVTITTEPVGTHTRPRKASKRR